MTRHSSVEKPEEQIIGFLSEAKAGIPIKDLCRQHGFRQASHYLCGSKFGGMTVPDSKRFRDLEAQSICLKSLLAEQVFENGVMKDGLRKTW